jgi:hypothetical protein
VPNLRRRHARSVPHGHLSVDAQNLPPFPADSQAKLVVLGGDDRRIVSANTAEGRHEDHGIAATRFDLSDRHVPLEVGKAVVDGLIAISLATPAVDHGDVGPLLEHCAGAIQPARRNLTVTVDDLNECDIRIELHQPLETDVSRPGRRERERQVQLDDFHIHGPRQLDTAVRRIRIDVHHQQTAPDQRNKALAEPFPFIAADGYDSQIAHVLSNL